jgi:hypothetical protein
VSEEHRFWLEWIVSALIAAGTIGAVVVALRLHVRVFPPRLTLRLVSGDGEPVKVNVQTLDHNGSVVHSRPEDARFYRVLLSNSRAWAAATEVGVFLVAIELEDASGKYAPTWSGSIPVTATHYGIHPTRTIGASPLEFDLCAVVRDKWLQLYPAVAVSSDFPYRYRVSDRPIRLRVTLQARSLETVSELFQFGIAWDSNWNDDTVKMRQHVVVRQLT